MKMKLFGIMAAVAMLCGTVQAVQIRTIDLQFTSIMKLGVKSDITAQIIENRSAPRNGKTVLVVSGLAHTAEGFKSLATNTLTGNSSIRRMVLLDLPGHGLSSDPYGWRGLLYGDLTLEDYTTVVIDTLQACRNVGIPVTEILGHSMGGLIVQMAQERQLKLHTTLRQRFGITKVVLLGSASPAEVFDPFLDSGYAEYLIADYIVPGTDRGDILEARPDVFLGFFFVDRSNQQLVVDPSEILGRGFETDESLAATLQTVGSSEKRPSVRQGAFAHCNGTELTIVIGFEDQLSDPDSEFFMYDHLTGDSSGAGFRIIDSPLSVHDQHIFDSIGVIPYLGL
jgi:pimeloyl-ACP methyl ester carboxylesterase